jgi:hypothetical protein
MRDIFRPNTTRRAKVARHKENCWKDHTRDKVMLGTSKGWTLERDNWRNYNLIRGTRTEPYRKMTGLEIAKQIVGSADSLRPDKDWTLWRGRPPQKRKKEKRPVLEEPVTQNTGLPKESELAMDECEE